MAPAGTRLRADKLVSLENALETARQIANRKAESSRKLAAGQPSTQADRLESIAANLAQELSARRDVNDADDLRERFDAVSNLHEGFGLKKPDTAKIRTVNDALQKGLATCFECKIIQWVSQGGDPVDRKERVAEQARGVPGPHRDGVSLVGPPPRAAPRRPAAPGPWKDQALGASHSPQF